MKSLKLRKTKDYIKNIEYSRDLNLSPLIFENNNLHNLMIYVNSWFEKLESIKVAKGEHEITLQVSENEYDKIIYPVYFIQANVGAKGKEGFINGVIRPNISEDLAKILPNAGQTFHFYYESLDDKLLGLSSAYVCKQLLVQFIDWNIEDYEKFKKENIKKSRNTVPSCFEVNINYGKNSDDRKYGRFVVNK